MILTAEQHGTIWRTVNAHLGESAMVRVFGSRLDDDKKGGDLDLFVEVNRPVSLMQRAALKLALEEVLSLPVDLLLSEQGKPLNAFQAVAKARSRPLDRHSA